LRLYVGNLQFDFTDEELSRIFSEHGQVASASIARDRETQRSKGFAFVEMHDELGFRQLLSRALAPGGHPIDLTGDWAEAWKLVQRNSYDCVILNLGLPAVNGMQLYERIRMNASGTMTEP